MTQTRQSRKKKEILASFLLVLIFVVSVFMVGFLPFILGILFLLLGLYLLWFSISNYRLWFHIKSTPTERVQAVSLGKTHLEGIAHPVPSNTKTAFDGRDCAYCYWQINEKYDDDWQTIKDGDRSSRLLLRDSTGEILIEDPTEAFPEDVKHLEPDHSEDETVFDESINRYELSTGHFSKFVSEVRISPHVETGTTPAGEQPPEPVAEWCRQVGISPVTDVPRQYKQCVVPFDETIYVFGEATTVDSSEIPGYDGDYIVSTDQSSDRFLLADRGEAKLVDALFEMWWRSLLGGVVLLGGGLFGIGVALS